MWVLWWRRSDEWSKKVFPQSLHSWSLSLVRTFLGGVDPCGKPSSWERDFLHVSTTQLSFSVSNSTSSAWASNLGHSGPFLPSFSLDVPSGFSSSEEPAPWISGLVFQSGIDRKHRCSFFSGLGNIAVKSRGYYKSGIIWSLHCLLPQIVVHFRERLRIGNKEEGREQNWQRISQKENFHWEHGQDNYKGKGSGQYGEE